MASSVDDERASTVRLGLMYLSTSPRLPAFASVSRTVVLTRTAMRPGTELGTEGDFLHLDVREEAVLLLHRQLRLESKDELPFREVDVIKILEASEPGNHGESVFPVSQRLAGPGLLAGVRSFQPVACSSSCRARCRRQVLLQDWTWDRVAGPVRPPVEEQGMRTEPSCQSFSIGLLGELVVADFLVSPQNNEFRTCSTSESAIYRDLYSRNPNRILFG